MFTALFDFFSSRPFAEMLGRRARVWLGIQTLLWAVVTFLLGVCLAGDFAVPGENAQILTILSGASPVSHESFPILWSVVHLLLGATPSMLALNIFGAGVVALLVAMTWLLVHFWVRDAMTEDSVAKASNWVPSATAHAVCALFLFTLPGLYAVSGWTLACWAFLMLLISVILQNGYAAHGGSRIWMFASALVLGVLLVESPWVAVCMPLLFLRVLTIEWRLWDRSVKNLPLWFVAIVLGAIGMIFVNAWRITGSFALDAAVKTELSVLRMHLDFLLAFIQGPYLIHFAGGVLLPALAWLTARQLLNNARAWGLLFTAAVLTLASFVCLFGVGQLPVRSWCRLGMIPAVTAWGTAVGCGMLLVGWGVQLFSHDPNRFEELDRRRIPAYVAAMRVGALFIFPLGAIAALATVVLHSVYFSRVDRALVNRFAQETLTSLSGGESAQAQGAGARSFLLGAPWLDAHLLLEAAKQGSALTLFQPVRATDAPYMDNLRKRLMEDPALGDADRLRLVHLLDYSFFTFVQDFFVSQENAMQIAATCELPDVWYAARVRPFPWGTVYLGIPETGTPKQDPLAYHRALRERWAKMLETPSAELPWWDLTAFSQRCIRHHLAFMANNLGVYLDDTGRLEEAADCYAYAHDIEPDNVSALLNLYDASVRRGALVDRRVAINRMFETFITARTKSPKKYDLSAVGRYYGYIRNYDLFVQMGWEWAVSAAPESVLAGLRHAQSGLSVSDPRNGVVQAVVAAVYEYQGQIQRSLENYRAAVAADPKNIEALRGLARLSIQKGNVNEAGQWLAKAEEAGADQESLDLDRAAYYMAIGNIDGAIKVIGRYTSKHKDTPVGWAMLGMIELEKGNEERASGFILQNIKRTAQGRDLYFLHVLEGRLAQYQADKLEKQSTDVKALPSAVARQDAAKHATEALESARKHYRRAYALRPNVRGLLELILDFDRRLDDKATAEADALAILREDTRHPYANFIVGSQRLGDAEVSAAVKYFRLAVEGNKEPSAPLLNNYAEALIRVGQMDQAKKVAVQGVRVAPEEWTSWATFALTLARGNEATKAKTALDKALTLAREQKKPVDPRIGFVRIWIALDNGNRAEAKELRDKLKEELGVNLTPLDVLDFKTIDNALSAERP